jgi:hypothetical protein
MEVVYEICTSPMNGARTPTEDRTARQGQVARG